MSKAALRYVNAYDVVQHWLKSREPDCPFEGTSRKDFETWRRAFLPRYRRCLGAWPESVPLRLEVVEHTERSDHLREKIVYDSCEGVSVPAWMLFPKGLARGERRPALVVCHGHGNGKDDMVGVTHEKGDPEAIKKCDELNYAYGLEAVRHGYVIIAPDWCPFGERRPPDWWYGPRRDACNVTDLAWRLFNRPLITQNIWDGMRAVDVLARHASVNNRRIGVIGLSYGGTMASHLLINEPRIKAGVVSGYISTLRGDALNERGKGNICGAQAVPSLLLYGDIPDMLGLAVPKPVLFEMGRKETCFHFPDMDRAYRHLTRIYKAAGAADRIARDIHPGGHRWSGRKAWAWLERRLR